MTHDEVARRIERERHAHLAHDRDQLVGVMERVKIGTADPACLHRDQHVAGARHGIRNVFHDEDAPTGDSGAHDGERTETAS